jgi:hypothetical protein
MIMSSTQMPLVFTAIQVPPIGLALPWPVATEVTPPLAAFRTLGSSGLKESSARSCGVQGSFGSL